MLVTYFILFKDDNRIQEVHVRKLRTVTKEAHVSGLVKEIYPPIILTKNSVVFNEKGMITAWLMKGIISQKMMLKLEKSARECSLGKFSTDSRGNNKKATLGSLVERGGSGKIHPQDHETPAGKKFLQKINKLIKYVSSIMSEVTPTHAFLVDFVPKKHRVLRKFSSCFWNRTVISMLQIIIIGGFVIAMYVTFTEQN